MKIFMCNRIRSTKATILMAGRYFSLWPAMKCKVKSAHMKFKPSFIIVGKISTEILQRNICEDISSVDFICHLSNL